MFYYINRTSLSYFSLDSNKKVYCKKNRIAKNILWLEKISNWKKSEAKKGSHSKI